MAKQVMGYFTLPVTLEVNRLTKFIRRSYPVISAILVSGKKTAAEAVSCLIDLSDSLKSMPIKEVPPSRCYNQVLEELKREAVVLKPSGEYLGSAFAFTCIPDTTGSWLCIEREPDSIVVLRLLFEAMRVCVRHGNYDNDNAVLEAVSAYPADRLRFAPPPILKADARAPTQAWQEVMDDLAKRPEVPVLTTSVSFKCQVCETAFQLGIGDCGHLVCLVCSLAWKTCGRCGSPWKISHFDKLPQMNYHPSIFPFKDWYEYLPVTGWYVYCGPRRASVRLFCKTHHSSCHRYDIGLNVHKIIHFYV